MKRDKKECENLWTFEEAADSKAINRLHHVVGIDQVPKKKGSIVIVDESDAIMLSDPINFYKQTKHKDTRVICLTATPDDGYTDGNEHKLIRLMGYKVIRTGEQKDMVAP